MYTIGHYYFPKSLDNQLKNTVLIVVAAVLQMSCYDNRVSLVMIITLILI